MCLGASGAHSSMGDQTSGRLWLPRGAPRLRRKGAAGVHQRQVEGDEHQLGQPQQQHALRLPGPLVCCSHLLSSPPYVGSAAPALAACLSCGVSLQGLLVHAPCPVDQPVFWYMSSCSAQVERRRMVQ